MNIRNLNITDLVKRKIRIYKKSRFIKKETDKIGIEERIRRRKERQKEIRKKKDSIIRGLISSSDLGEIRLPSKDTYTNLRYFYQSMTLEYLISLEKDCWNDIYKNR
jgi:hypothetical protein